MAYNKLSTANLPEPDISPANDAEPRDYFETFLYTGNGGGLQVGDIIKKPADTTTISNSLVFNDNDSAYLSRTPSSGGSQTTFTLSCWVKRADTNTEGYLFSAANTSATTEIFYIQLRSDTNSNTLSIVWRDGSTTTRTLVTDRAFKNSATWDHFVVAVNTNESTDADKIKVYINGVLETNFSADSRSTLSSSSTLAANAASTLHTIGVYSGTLSGYLDGYLAEYHFVDGTAHEPTDFGNFDANGIWIPKTVTAVTDYGANGFHLDFSDNTSTTTLGADSSGNGNDWTLNNFATTDQSTDSPTDNVPYNISIQGGSVTISEGNLKTSVSTDNRHARTAMRLPPRGKWYWEAEILVTNTNHGISIVNRDYSLTATAINNVDAVTYNVQNGVVLVEGDGGTAYVSAPVNNTVGVAFDSDTGKIWFRNDAGWLNSGDPAAGTGYVGIVSTWGQEDWFPAVISHGSANKQTYFNFGQRAFTHTVPTGFSAMTENNITVDDQNLESPDLVWIKNRSAADHHHWYDSVRGVQKALYSSLPTTAQTDEPNGLLDFNKNGFTIGSEVEVNTSGEDYVAWCWKANGSGVSNNAGTTPSTVSANTTAGFSIVKWTSPGTVTTVGHGLSQKPDMIIYKRLEDSYGWIIGHSSLPNSFSDRLLFNSDPDSNNNSSPFNLTEPTASVMTIGTYSATSGKDHIAYVFHSVEGFSKFGSYTGNNSTDGPFVYTGFRPAFLVVKTYNTTGSWVIRDTKRDDGHNDGNITPFMYADATTAEATISTSGRHIDFLSNGFKVRENLGITNSTNSFIYMAFAETPFKYATAR